ncbi:hypothetical protein [Lichenicoccus roseus]|uniref:Methyl-accepting chemotaxis protein n=1 Tax=Lichenicoccus roseus TaxID=2683649 RepID=A0A5R9JAZ6_9PROT|nr:hypothetical protein [Lichenicoccus roseus]TLU72781.1 hypothetical protein FE263_12250 [Lichenicoccus roseus]
MGFLLTQSIAVPVRAITLAMHCLAHGDLAIEIPGVGRTANATGASAGQVLDAAGGLSRQAETLSSGVNGSLASVRAA